MCDKLPSRKETFINLSFLSLSSSPVCPLLYFLFSITINNSTLLFFRSSLSLFKFLSVFSFHVCLYPLNEDGEACSSVFFVFALYQYPSSSLPIACLYMYVRCSCLCYQRMSNNNARENTNRLKSPSDASTR